MPWVPVLRGPLPPALAAISLRAFSSVSSSAIPVYVRHRKGQVVGMVVPARFFSWKAMSSSSRSLTAFLACFKGLTLPPRVRKC